MKHINVALFVPDAGCPHRCSFCNQKTISGSVNALRPDEIDSSVKTALSSADCNEGEIAFFGGSFTAIDREYMISLLARAYAYVNKGLFKGIRISTRPDCISQEILVILKKYGVTAIELGCQSMDDDVLLLNSRGHSKSDVIRSVEMIKHFGFELGLQMMTGLYGDTEEKTIATAESIISLKPDTVRIYPTVVLEGTRLCELYRQGEYRPQTVEEAAQLCKRLLKMFNEANIRVIRLGLHSGGNVDDGFVAGAYHPAFREICESKLYFDEVVSQIESEAIPKGKIEITVGNKYVSMLTGQKKSNLHMLNDLGYEVTIVQNKDYPKYKVSVRG
ncbi:MAG: radical SAM protein [Ruminococcaceae bacterium]|nr:radical SAM protein [Oscillospiraceae bacterium]